MAGGSGDRPVSPIRNTDDTLEAEIAACELERTRAAKELRDIEYILGALLEERHMREGGE